MKRTAKRRLAGLAVVAAIVAVSAVVIVPELWRAAAERHLMHLLTSTDEEARKQGAWQAVTRSPGPATDFMCAALSQGREPSPGVRESYVYALGRMRLQSALPLLLRLARADESGYVRQAAWIAAARVDFEQFRAAAREVENCADTWDRIGIATALMEADDFSQLDLLFDVAASGDDFQRNVAAAALRRYLRPLLQAAGRWPVNAEISVDGAWSPAFIAEVRGRAASLNLPQIAAHSRPEQQGTETLRRMIRRIYGARERVVRALYSIEVQ
ncbi:MAG: HEAT repeat domain-containing protein [Phycisphaerae bacterium]|nr:HEAT repeat domain-containing protein [Phycisphaerae bacterium]HOO17016.1 HEAT repeat domain-containing protein [Phycisphaerae bacterium]HPC22486.1 HEAT repeat domain-containing protein [Phycisphaerae bacterium]HRS27585.1 HEAT repeat domain-containing protein [Phycisphaerae bacterium]HRT41756.1 HEAT repeat domain-containing protein [Phycisphaerae bacterium]